jgi:hypothetical protein
LRRAAGAPFHAAGVTANGLRVCDVWESEAVFQKFAEGKIGPITEAVGQPTPEVRSFEISQVRGRPPTSRCFASVASILLSRTAMLDE